MIKSGKLIDKQEEISKQLNIQPVAWILLVAFSEIENENQEQQIEPKDSHFAAKETPEKLWPRTVFLLTDKVYYFASGQ